MSIATVPNAASAQQPHLRLPTPLSLSARLRNETAAQHAQVERQLRLPGSITGLAEYKSLV
jgi:hypothetical protein